MAASESVHELAMLKRVLTRTLIAEVRTLVIVDSKDLYHTLSSERNPVDKAVRPDVNSLRFLSETFIDLFAWIQGSANAAQVETKTDSPLTKTEILTMETGLIQTYLTGFDHCSCNMSYG